MQQSPGAFKGDQNTEQQFQESQGSSYTVGPESLCCRNFVQQHIQFHLLTTFVPQSCFIYG